MVNSFHAFLVFMKGTLGCEVCISCESLFDVLHASRPPSVKATLGYSAGVKSRLLNSSDGNRFQFPKSIIGNKSNSILELESVSWCADCGI